MFDFLKKKLSGPETVRERAPDLDAEAGPDLSERQHRRLAVMGGQVMEPALPVLSDRVRPADLMLANEVTRISSEVGSLARSFDKFQSNIHELNVALGQMQQKLLVPLKDELDHLRYNTGAKVEQSTTQLNAIVNHLDRQLTTVLKAAGFSSAQVAGFKEEAGIAPNAPTGEELENEVRTRELLQTSNEELIAQNQRLTAKVAGLQGQVERLLQEKADTGKSRPKRRRGKGGIS